MANLPLYFVRANSDEGNLREVVEDKEIALGRGKKKQKDNHSRWLGSAMKKEVISHNFIRKEKSIWAVYFFDKEAGRRYLAGRFEKKKKAEAFAETFTQ